MEGGDEGELSVSTMRERQAPKPTGVKKKQEIKVVKNTHHTIHNAKP